MRSELLGEAEEIGCINSNYKTAKVYFAGNFLRSSDRLDMPILEKKKMKYDKYELNKLIPFEHFQLLIRPFKNNPAFKSCLFWNNLFLVACICMLAITQLFSKMNSLPTISTFILAIIVISIFIFLLICKSLSNSNAKRVLMEYCQQLDLKDQQISIMVVPMRVERNLFKWIRREKECLQIESFCFFELSHFQIRSRRVLEDNKSVKLYNYGQLYKGLADLRFPIFDAKDFEFDNLRLRRFIFFQELEFILRSYKQTSIFKRRLNGSMYLYWCSLSCLLETVLIIIYMIFDPLMDTFGLIAFVFLIIVIFLTIIGIIYFMRLRFRLKKQLPQQFVNFCTEVSEQQRVGIIAHLNENHREKLYYIEIKQKEDQIQQ